jgi:hypothetical protein
MLAQYLGCLQVSGLIPLTFASVLYIIIKTL